MRGRAKWAVFVVSAVILGLATSCSVGAEARGDSESRTAASSTGLRIILEVKSRKPLPSPAEGAAHQKGRLAIPAISDSELAETTRVIEERITGYGLSKPTIQTERTSGDSPLAHIIVDISGERHDDETYAALKSLLTTPGDLQFLAVPRAYGDLTVTRVAGHVVYTFTGADGREVPTSTVIAKSRPLVSDRGFEPDAQVISRPGQPTAVSFRLKESARPAFREFTGEHIGTWLAVVLDGRMLSCPVIKAAIPGEGVILSDFDELGGRERAKQLAVMINSGSLPLEVRYHAVAGGAEAALKALDPLRNEEPYGSYAYLDALEETIREAISANQLDAAMQLAAGYEAYPLCEQAPRTLLRLAQALRAERRFEQAVDSLRKGVELDPFSQEAPESLELLADILDSDLGRIDEARAARVRLAVNYFPSIPSVAEAIDALGENAPKTPRGKMILLDSTLMESSIYDRCPTGGCNFGQYEVIRALTQAGYVVHETRQCPELTPAIMDHYGLLVLNGRYGGVLDPPIPAHLIGSLVDYVKGGGNLLVMAGGKALGEGQEPQFYNPLLSHFGLRFAEGVTLPYKHLAGRLADHPAVRGLSGFHWEHGVPVVVDQGEILGYAGQEPVIAIAQCGRGRVIAAGLGSGFMGQCLGLLDPESRDTAANNKVLLVTLAGYVLGPAQ